VRKKALVFTLLFVVGLIGCVPTGPHKVSTDGQVNDIEVVVDWVQINPPPTFSGPCYAFFEQEGLLEYAIGWAGVVCENLEVDQATTEQVDWYLINTPPNFEGPCYAFFEQESLLNYAIGWAGVVCKNYDN
jgi:hypothetical protein